MSIENRYHLVSQRMTQAIKKYSIKRPIELLAVSKKQDIEKIHQLYNLGQRQFGESYISEAIEKIETCLALGKKDMIWHFIGPLQSNKTKYVAEHFSWVQSIDSYKLLNRLNSQRHHLLPKLNVLLQLKVDDEITKRGLDRNSLLKLASRHNEFENLNFRGLMCIPRASTNHATQVKQFKLCHTTFELMQEIVPVDTLSIGMSTDLEAAIESGSTMVRIGTDLFGSRS